MTDTHAQTPEEVDGLLSRTTDFCNRSVKSTSSLDARSQKEIDSLSETPLFPFNFKEFAYIIFVLLRAGIPSSFAFVAALFRGLLSLTFIGRYATSKELAGASLATSFAQMILMTLIFTINLGFLIKSSHLIGAAKFDELKTLVQRHLCVVATIAIPVLSLLSFCDYLLEAVGVDPDISRAAVEYFRLTLLSWIGMIMCDLFKSFLMSHGYFAIIGITQGVSLAAHIGLCYWFVFGLDMPFAGPAIVKSITDFGVALAFFVFIMCNPKLRRPFLSWSTGCLRGWWGHFKQMTVMGFDILVDCALLEFSLLIVLYLNNEHVMSAHSFAMTLTGLLFMIPMGNSMAMQTKIGNAVGENMKYKAKKFMAGGLVLNLIVCTFFITVSFFWNEQIVNELTNIPETNAIVRKFLYVYTAVYFADSYKDHLAGILKTIGKEHEVFMIYLFCNITIGAIAQWVLSLWLGFGYVGIWLGVAISMSLTCVMLVGKLAMADWDKEIAGVQERLQMMYIEEKIQEKDNF